MFLHEHSVSTVAGRLRRASQPTTCPSRTTGARDTLQARSDQAEVSGHAARRRVTGHVLSARPSTPPAAAESSPRPGRGMTLLRQLSRAERPDPRFGPLSQELRLVDSLVQVLGTSGSSTRARAQREPLVNKLLGLYEHDPDAGVHGAAEWTLRQLPQDQWCYLPNPRGEYADGMQIKAGALKLNGYRLPTDAGGSAMLTGAASGWYGSLALSPSPIAPPAPVSVLGTRGCAHDARDAAAHAFGTISKAHPSAVR